MVVSSRGPLFGSGRGEPERQLKVWLSPPGLRVWGEDVGRKKGRMADALAHGGDEGRDNLR